MFSSAWIRSLATIAIALLAPAAGGCGAKTGLLAPELFVAQDAEVPDDVFVRFDACVAGQFPMVRRSAELMFVLDRSGSMTEPLESSPGALTRWESMRRALNQTLPRFDRTLEMGAMFYPRVPNDGVVGNQQYCDLAPSGAIDVPIGRNNADEVVLSIFNNYPRGGTPTAAALRRATDYLRSREARGRARYMVLATDGAPNCNAGLDGAVCTCLDGDACQGSARGGQWCLDDQGAVDAIARAAAVGVSTYVIGIDGDIPQIFVNVLDRMAVAGGRPRPMQPGEPRYYSIRRFDQLVGAFEDIQRTVAQCSYVTPSRPDDPDAIEVLVNGAATPRDRNRVDGWDWTDRDYGELTLFGPTCDRAIATNAGIIARVMCRGR